MSAYERLGRTLREPLTNATGDDRHRDLMAAAGCELQSQIAAGLALYLTGDHAGVNAMLGLDQDVPPALPAAVATAPILAAFGAATEAINAAVGDDASRGYAALATLRERAAEFTEARNLLVARHAAPNPG